eukprot:TRINITY_DN1359_c0_g1_i3.p1 TRINITY_DN1359_c0_g1~~TRINITY_DN1359_c0_g1_i3.p1  ORF type:complete len:301 (-),score=26.07 TRINITY_DN1359_c0_g1_i3:220-1122(-)
MTEMSDGPTFFMPAVAEGSGMFGIKIVSVRNDNSQRNLPTVPAVIIIFEAKTGIPKSFMDASYVTLLRTAAGSGVATQYMAKRVCHKLSIFGAGKQAKLHAEAILSVRPMIKELYIFNRSKERAQSLVQELKSNERFRNVSIIISTSQEDTLRNADVVVTATAATTPLFDGNLVTPGTHINCIGTHNPKCQEVDEITVKKSKVIVDHLTAAFSEAGDILVPISKGIIGKDHVLGELGQVVGGLNVRTSDRDITLFKSVGIAIQDLMTAIAIYKGASKNGVGKLVDLSTTTAHVLPLKSNL